MGRVSPTGEAHLSKVADGRLAKGTLAWMLGVEEANLDTEDPTAPDKADQANLRSYVEQ